MATPKIKWQLNAANVNDGIFNATFPMNPNINYTCVDMTSTLATLSTEFNRIPAYVQALGGEVEFVVGLPSGYMHAKHPSKAHPIKEFFGHPSGNHFSSARQFIKHCVWLMGIGDYALHKCACELC